jgi:hypothetical protein
MKVHQIVSEKRTQLNELVPVVIGGIGIGAIFTAISALISAYGVYQLYELYGKYNEDPDSVTDEEWDDIWIDLALVAMPGFAKLGKVGLSKLIPKAWKRKGGQWLKKKVSERLAQLEKQGQRIEKFNLRKFDPDSKVGFEKIKAYLKMKASNAAMKQAAQARMGFIPSSVMTVLKTAVGLEFIREYYEDLTVLEEEYKKFQAGEPSAFTGMEPDKAYAKYQQVRNKLMGELVIGVAMNMGVASKAFGALGGMFGGITQFAARSSGSGIVAAEWMGRVVKLPFAVAKGLAKLLELGPAAPAFLIFMRSDSGKEFLNSTLVQMITQPAGMLASGAINLLEAALQAAGLLDPGQTIPGKTTVKPPASGDADTDSGAYTNKMDIQWLGKKLYVDNQQISDENGYRIVGNNKIDDIKNDARVAGVPDPTLKLRDDPNRKYSYYGADAIK